jgi:HNH endonuclease
MAHEEKFWSKVSKENECWLWCGCLALNGYGGVTINRKRRSAHRVAWELSNGQIPGGMCVLHKCDNRRCVNPAHLFLGTYRDNAIDRENKKRGRQPVGEGNGKSKLTQDVVQSIKRWLSEGKTKASIARKLGLSFSGVRSVAIGRTWKHVKENGHST